MKKSRFFRTLLALLLCAALVLPCLPLNAFAAKLGNFDTGSDFSGVKLSLIGDSISTFYGYSNSTTYNPLYLSTSEATFGTYYGNTSHDDYAEFSDMKWTDTWWKQTVDTLGMDLLVNNAWSGSFTLVDTGQSNTTEYPAAGYKTRAVNLHNGSTNPDIICVYLGTNDIAYYSTQSIGNKTNIDTASERSALYTSVNNYGTPSTAIQAYYIMISRMLAKYPDAEIYCLLPTICLNTMSSGRLNALNTFNEGVRYIVDLYSGNGEDIFLVDLPEHSGLVDQDTVRSYYYCNNVHPNPAGMDWITSCLVSEILEHSKKGNRTSEICSVDYDLDRTFVKNGLPRKTVVGKPFSVDLLPYEDGKDFDITVTMKDASGKEVLIPGYGDSGTHVYIPEVTGDISIKSAYRGNSYYWKASNDAFMGVYGNGYSFNDPTLISGTYSASGDTGTMGTAQYSLEEAVILRHDKPWTLEWKSGGNTYAGGIMLFNRTADSADTGNMYIHITQSNVFFGYRDSNGYNNSGIAWTTIAEKLGSTAGADIRNEMLEFKVVNVPNGTNNKMWLYVNGVQIGTLDQVKMIGGSTTDSNVSKINTSGKDFIFNYFGSASHSWQNCNISYIRAYENGALEPDTSFADYRWELNASGNDFASVENETFTENALTKLSGSVSGGTFTGTSYALHKDVVLMHDKTWTIEWASSGDWVGDRNGSMLLGSDLYYKAVGAPYIYRKNASTFIAIGEWKNGVHNNYGVSLSDHGIDGTAYHKYALRNEVTMDTSGNVTDNMVYLYVDDAKIAPMTTYYSGADATNTTSDWIKGKDFVFSNIGTTEFTVGGCDLDYLQINTGCAHSFGAWSTATAATCTETGVKVRTCQLCGEEETEQIAATGHSYTSVAYDTNCQTYAHTCYTCVSCGHSYNTYPDDVMSDWQADKPAVDESMIETATQYRYSDYETTASYETSLEGYERISTQWEKYDTGTVSYVNSWPSGFSTTNSLYNKYNNKSQKVSASITDTTKVEINSDQVVGYLYYHWCYTNSTYSVESKSGSYTTFHAYYSTTSPDNYTCDTSDMSYKTSNTSCCTNSNWFFVTEVKDQVYTTYKGLHTYGKWGTPSAWSLTPMEASDTRKVETRTAYRYVTGELGSHNYVNGICSVCGQAKPVVDYYLFGYINGANYACEEDYENMGTYKFVDGKLVAKFDQDSYVAVKTTGNASWYMTDGWQGNNTTSVTLYNTNSGITADKLFVPGGVDLEFTLVEGGDDTLTLRYEILECEHDYRGTITKQPTCTAAGVRTYCCMECGDTYQEIISATGHSNEAVVTKPTCTESGYTTYTCTVCGESYTGDTVDALGHSYSSTIVPPTCTEEGYTKYTCGACGSSYTDDKTAAEGHEYVDGTCTKCGAADPDYVAPVNGSYVLVSSPAQVTSGGKFVIVANNNGAYNAMDTTIASGKFAGVDVTVSGNTVVGTNLPVWDIASTTDGVTISINGSYLTYNSSTNFKLADTPFTFELTEDYQFVASENSRAVYYQISTDKFGAYATSNANNSGYVASLQLYKFREEGAACEHNYVDGFCTDCGEADPNYVAPTDYYLFGYINGANYACEEDYENMGIYKFVDGVLTAKFDTDSYVAVKTTGNAAWYMTDGWQGNETTTVTLYNTESGITADKLFVPGGVEVTFTLTAGANDTLILSYETAAVEPSVQPTITLKYPTLVFEDVIMMNVYFAASDLGDVAEMGLVTYTESVTSADVNTANAVIPGYSWSAADGLYYATTNGIAAKDLGDELYFAVYAKLADGTYYYTRVVSYSPSKYAYSSLATGSASMKPIVVAMLNYGAAAQTYFNYKTDSLVNANLTADQKALVEDYRADMITAVSAPSTAKQGTLVTNGGFSRRYPTVSFEGAFCINYYCIPSATVQGELTLYYWDQATYDANSVLTTQNATAAIPMVLNNGEYHAAVEGIAAKDLSRGVYVAFVYSDGTTTYSSGVLAYSIGTYCSTQAMGTGTTAALAKATAVYGYYANELFNKGSSD